MADDKLPRVIVTPEMLARALERAAAAEAAIARGEAIIRKPFDYKVTARDG